MHDLLLRLRIIAALVDLSAAIRPLEKNATGPSKEITFPPTYTNIFFRFKFKFFPPTFIFVKNPRIYIKQFITNLRHMIQID